MEKNTRRRFYKSFIKKFKIIKMEVNLPIGTYQLIWNSTSLPNPMISAFGSVFSQDLDYLKQRASCINGAWFIMELKQNTPNTLYWTIAEDKNFIK